MAVEPGAGSLCFVKKEAMRHFDTLVEALNTLKKEGYQYDFNLDRDCLSCRDLQQTYPPEKFAVVEIFRFEGASNPADNSILFVIETNDGTKGTLLDAYGAYSGEISDDMLQKLKSTRRP